MLCRRTGFHESRNTDVLKALKLVSEIVSGLDAAGLNQAYKNKWEVSGSG